MRLARRRRRQPTFEGLLNRLPWWTWAAAATVILAGGAGIVVAKTRKEHVQRLWMALSQNTTLGTYPKLILIAQAILETGWMGTGTAARYARNFWNVSAGSQWKGPVIGGGDTECDAMGQNCVPITQKWRKYSSDGEAVRDFISFITMQNGGRYMSAYERLVASDAVGFVRELRAKGYFTASLEMYTKAVTGVINSVKGYLGLA